MLTLRRVQVAADTWYRATKVDNRVPWTLLCVSCGFIFFKQYINVVKLVETSKRLAEGDLGVRKNADLPRREKVH